MRCEGAERRQRFSPLCTQYDDYGQIAHGTDTHAPLQLQTVFATLKMHGQIICIDSSVALLSRVGVGGVEGGFAESCERRKYSSRRNDSILLENGGPVDCVVIIVGTHLTLYLT